MKRKLVTIIIIVILLLQCNPAAIANDISGHYDENAMRALASLNILRGYEDGNFYPDNSITREEYITFIIRLLNLEDAAKSISGGNVHFYDVTEQHWSRRL